MPHAATLPATNTLAVPFRVPDTLHVDYQRLLTQTAHLLLQDCDADTLCQSIFELIREPLRLDVYFHFLVAEERTHLRLASSGGNEEVRAALGTDLQFGQAVCGKVAQTCEWMYVTGVQQRHDDMTSLIRSYGVRCYSCQPLILKGEIVGTLSFGSCQRDYFKEEELELFGLIAQQVNVVTQRRRQTDQLLQLEQLATAGRMCATLAHEINNPLDSLSTLLYLLRDEMMSEEGREFAVEANRQVKRLAETTQRTLDLFRGKQQKPQLVNVSELVTDLLANMRFPETVRMRTSIEEGICAKAVAGELRQVLFNLANNAAQFTPPNGEVLVSVGRKNGSVEIRVKDEGPGITDAMRPNLFRPFYTTRANGGTGLGLWVSRQMVERIDGTLAFYSNPELCPGTDFVVTLPAAHA